MLTNDADFIKGVHLVYNILHMHLSILLTLAAIESFFLIVSLNEPVRISCMAAVGQIMFILDLIIIQFPFSDVRNVYGALDKLRHWPHFGSTANMIHWYIIVDPCCVIYNCAQMIEIKISKMQQKSSSY